jgi:hypothetical protein
VLPETPVLGLLLALVVFLNLTSDESEFETAVWLDKTPIRDTNIRKLTCISKDV